VGVSFIFFFEVCFTS